VKKTKKQAFLRGTRAEKWGLVFLWLKGYKILKGRFKTNAGEIDLIVMKSQGLFFYGG
jgi:Holliday junction resolvase-like predicted endonuclease